MNRRDSVQAVLAAATVGLLPALMGSRQAHAQSAPAERHEISIDDARLLLLIPADQFPAAYLLVAWVQRSARTVAHYYGRFPVSAVRIVLVPIAGARVASGTTFGQPEPRIRLRVGTQVEAAALLNDWVLVHEMIHLALPDVGDDHAWLAEGLAVYIEGVARVQAGNRTVQDVFAEEQRTMPGAMPGPAGAGLDHDHGWGRTYWGGAMFCLLADVQIHERTDNRHGLRDAMRAVLHASGGLPADWDINRVFATADAAVGVPVLSSLYAQMKDKPVAPDLNALWHRLGVAAAADGTIRIDDQAPLAQVRKAIFSPT